MAKHPNKNSFLIFCSVEINWRSLFTEKFNQQLSHTQPAAAESQLRVQMLRRQRAASLLQLHPARVRYYCPASATPPRDCNGRAFGRLRAANKSTAQCCYTLVPNCTFQFKTQCPLAFLSKYFNFGTFSVQKKYAKRVYFVCGRISDKFWPTFVVNS